MAELLSLSGLLAPQPIRQKAERVKRVAEAPTFETLKPQQAQAIEDLKAFVESEDSGYHLLEGYAGTGKSFTVNMFTEYLLTTCGMKVAVTATTNKAVKVMRDFGEFTHPNLEYMTIHSLLALREQIDNYGKQSFVQINAEACRINEFDVVFIDEVSQLSDDLFKLIDPYLEASNLKIIFIGDSLQIPPVNKEDCIPLDKDMQAEYAIGVSSLTEVQRQAQDNPIIALSMKVRKAIGRPTVLPTKDSVYNEHTHDGVYFINDTKSVDAILQAYFKCPNFVADVNYMRVLAWRNATVDAYNKKVRRLLYGAKPAKLNVGERLVVRKPVTHKASDGVETILFTTNDELEVVSFKVDSANYEGAELKFYATEVLHKTVREDVYKVIRIIHEDSEADNALIAQHLKDKAVAEKPGTAMAGQYWREYFKFLSFFADVKYNYACTVHTSQGSTYQNCMVIDSDIDTNRKVRERNRIKYTAYTRPTSRLFIVN